MPYKDINTKRLKQKIQKQKKRDEKKECRPNIAPEYSPKQMEYQLEQKHFEYIFDIINLREIMMRKTRFNHWINLHLGVLDEIKIKFQNK